MLNIRAVRLRNFLSFGDDTAEIRLSGLTTIVGPNGSGKTGLLRAIEVVCSHMIRPKLLPEAYHHNGDIMRPVNIEIDVEFDDAEVRIMSDFLTCACIAQMESAENPYRPREKQVLRKILQGSGKTHFADACGKMTVILRAEGSLEHAEVVLRIGEGDCHLDVWNGETVMVASATKRGSSFRAAHLILDRAAAEVSGLKSYMSGRSKELPAGLDDFVVDLFEIMRDTGSGAFKLGVFRSEMVEIMKDYHREFIRTQNFLGGRVPGTIRFDKIVARLFSRSIVKMSEMQTRPEKMPLTRNMPETDIENITGLDLARTLLLMGNSGDPVMILRYKEIVSKMSKMTGLDVSVQISYEQNKKDHLADPKIAVRFMKGSLPIPAELVAGGDIELLTILTALIGRSSKILLLDEPASSLHPNRQKEVLDLMRETSEEGGNQIVLVTHSPFLTDPYGREPLWRFVPDTAGTKVVDAGKILSEHGQAGKVMQGVDVRSMMFQQGVIIVEGLSDKILIESADSLMVAEVDGVGIAGNEWMVLDAGGKDSVPSLSRLAEELGMQYVSVVDRDALMKCEKKTRIGGNEVQVPSAIRHINDTYGLSANEQETVMDAGRRASANGGKEYDADDFGALSEIARSRGMHVLNSDIEGVAGAKRGGTRSSKIEIALEQVCQMRETGRVPEGLADLVRSLGKAIADTGGSGSIVLLPSS